MRTCQLLDSAAVVEVIKVEVIEGAGVQGDPARRVTYYRQKDGAAICRIDDHEIMEAARPKLPPPTPTPFQRPIVRAFADEMEKKLRANDHKGGWSRVALVKLLKRLRQEVAELEKAVVRMPARGAGAGVAAVVEEAADCGNFAMMIADVASDGLLVE